MSNRIENKFANLSDFDSLDHLLTAYGSTWALDIVNFYPFIIISTIGLALSVLCFVIYLDPKLDIPLYKYMRVHSVVSAAMCALSIFWFINCAFRVAPFTNSYWTQIASINVILPLTNLLYFYSSLLDIATLIERITIYNAALKRRFSWSPYKLSAVMFVACVVLDSGYFFFYSPGCTIYPIDNQTNFTVCYFSDSDFSRGLFGQFITYFLIAFRDILLLVAIIVLNIVLNVLFKRFLEKKGRLVGPIVVQNNSQPRSDQNDGNEASNSNNNRGVRNSEKKLTKMVTIICVLSTLEHIFVIIGVIVNLFNPSLVIQSACLAIGALFWPLKRCIQFYVYVAFNHRFRDILVENIKKLNIYRRFYTPDQRV